MAQSSFNLYEAKKIIFSQEDISLSIRRSAWKLFLHELERPGVKGKTMSQKKALDGVLGWMIIQKKREEISSFKLNPIQKRILYLMVVDGYTQGQAALELNRSRETIKQYCINLRKQLGVDSFNQVIAIAVEKGWIPAPSFHITKKV